MDSHNKAAPESSGSDGKTTPPAPAVPTSETTPIWARTIPVVEPAVTSSQPPLPLEDPADELLPPDLSDLEPVMGEEVDLEPRTGEEVALEPATGEAVALEPATGEEVALEPPTEEAALVEPGKAEPDEAAETSEPDGEPLAARPMQKTAPDWAKTDPPSEPAIETDPKRAVPMQKQPPAWAQTVPAPAGEAVEDGPAVTPRPTPAWPPASTAPSTPPAQSKADSRADDEVWPPEPPTERSMPAWPPSSTISEARESAEIPADAISSWPDDFGSKPPKAEPAPAAPVSETKPKPALVEQAPTVVPAQSKPQVVPPKPKPADATAEIKPAPASVPPPPVMVKPAGEVKPALAPPPSVVKPKPLTAAVVKPAPAPPPPTPVKPKPIPAAAQVQPAPAPPPAPAPTPPPVPSVKDEPSPPAEPKGPAKPMQDDPWADPVVSAKPPARAPAAAPADSVDWPAPVDVPAWAPRIHIGPARPDYVPPVETAAASAPAPAPKPAPAPAKPTSTPQPAASAAQSPTASRPAAGQSKPSWGIVEQQRKADPAKAGPTPEDRSYAEWFAWAKRGGAPASACHAAAQGAFQALAGGKDVAVAVQWATAAMARPPVPVTAARQTYCAWFSLANIDLNMDQHKAHAFANAAVLALNAGADASSAHAAGLKAAGVS